MCMYIHAAIDNIDMDIHSMENVVKIRCTRTLVVLSRTFSL